LCIGFTFTIRLSGGYLGVKVQKKTIPKIGKYGFTVKNGENILKKNIRK